MRCKYRKDVECMLLNNTEDCWYKNYADCVRAYRKRLTKEEKK